MKASVHHAMSKARHLLIILCIASLFPAYMFYRPVKVAWAGQFPSIKIGLQIAPDIMTDTEMQLWIDTLKNQAAKFFASSGANVSIVPGQTHATIGEPDSFITFVCNSDSGADIKKVDAFTSTSEDRDCTGSSCTYLWSCENSGRTIGGSIQLNFSQFTWSPDSGSSGGQDLQRELMHNFGHILGLDHCRVGEKRDACRDDPGSEALMYRFLDGGSREFAADDKLGLQKLYGILNLPFPASGKYSLSPEEANAIEDLIAFESLPGLNGPQARERRSRMAREMQNFILKESGKDLRQHTDEFFVQARASLSAMSPEDLRMGLKVSAVAIYYADRMIRDTAEKGSGPFDLELLRHAKGLHENLRRTSIDLLETRL